VAAQVLRTRIASLWPDLAGQSVLGIGYPQPYMQLWRATAYRCLAATSSHHALPRDVRGACAIEPNRLPFPDLSFDRILVIHGVEPSGHDERLLREIWRVLKDDGRMLVVAPNRMGLWAHAEGTPFGQGQPYSNSQITHLLAGAMFRAERRDTALFTPPSTWGAILAFQGACERLGRWLLPNFAGVTLTEAVKDIYAALPTEAVQRRVVLQEAA
jgi:SAM-dependent methyltransferase